MCPDSLVVLVGNKADLDERREIPKEIGLQFADEHSLPFFEVSAKTGNRVHDVFAYVAQTLAAKRKAKLAGSGGPGALSVAV